MCQTNIFVFFDSVNRLVNQQNVADVVYLDFIKLAINSVCKTETMWNGWSTVRWFHRWLNNHSQCMVFNGSMSIWREVCSGIPVCCTGQITHETLCPVLVATIQ